MHFHSRMWGFWWNGLMRLQPPRLEQWNESSQFDQCRCYTARSHSVMKLISSYYSWFAEWGPSGSASAASWTLGCWSPNTSRRTPTPSTRWWLTSSRDWPGWGRPEVGEWWSTTWLESSTSLPLKVSGCSYQTLIKICGGGRMFYTRFGHKRLKCTTIACETVDACFECHSPWEITCFIVRIRAIQSNNVWKV